MGTWAKIQQARIRYLEAHHTCAGSRRSVTQVWRAPRSSLLWTCLSLVLGVGRHFQALGFFSPTCLLVCIGTSSTTYGTLLLSNGILTCLKTSIYGVVSGWLCMRLILRF